MYRSVLVPNHIVSLHRLKVLFYNMCVLMFMSYMVRYFTGIFYAVVRQISMLLIDNKDSVFCVCMLLL